MSKKLSFLSCIFGSSNSSSTQKERKQKHLSMETLESRALLSVSPYSAPAEELNAMTQTACVATESTSELIVDFNDEVTALQAGNNSDGMVALNAAAGTQTVSGEASNNDSEKSIIENGDIITVTVKYQFDGTEAPKGLGLRTHYDSTKLSFKGATYFYNGSGTDLEAEDLEPQADDAEQGSEHDDGDVTDKVVVTPWMVDSGTWTAPEGGILVKYEFKVIGNAGDSTNINFTADKDPASPELYFTGQSVTIKIATEPTPSGELTAPTNFKADETQIKTDSITLTWDQVNSATGYNIQYSTSEKFESEATKDVVVQEGTTTSATISDLTAGTKYYFRILATGNEGKKSEYSDVTSATTLTPLTAPEKLTAGENIETTKIPLTWEAVNYATGYNIQYSTSDKFDSEDTNDVDVKEGKTTSATISDLTAGTKYYFRIKAYGDDKTYSESKYSDAINATTADDLTPLTAPTDLQVNGTPTKHEVVLTWSKVDNNAGYQILYSKKGATEQQKATVEKDATTTTISGLDVESEYSFQIVTKGDKKTSEDSKPSTPAVVAKTADRTQLTAPTLTSTEQTALTITLSWENVENNNGYQIVYTKADGTEQKTVGVEKGTTSKKIDGLTPETSYSFQIVVKGTGDYKDSDPSTAKEFKTAAQSPLTKPADLTVGDVTSSTISMSWTAVDHATGYTVMYSTDKEFPTDGSSTLDVTTNSAKLEKLTSSTKYYFKVMAKGVGEYKDSDYCDAKDATTAAPEVKQLDAPTEFKADENLTTINSITLTWKGVENAKKYTVSCSTSDGTLVKSETVETLTYTFSELAADTTYNFTVVAKADGYTESKATECSAKTNIKLDTPTNFKADETLTTTDSITLTWMGVENAKTYTVSYTKDGKIVSKDTEDCTCTFSELTADTTYDFSVMALGEKGYEPSESATCTATTAAEITVYQDGKNICINSGLKASEELANVKFQYKVDAVKSQYAWLNGTVTTDDAGNLIGIVPSSYLAKNLKYDVRFVNDGETLKEDVLTTKNLTVPVLTTKAIADSTTDFTFTVISADKNAADQNVSYRVYSNYKWSDWSSTYTMSDLMKSGIVTAVEGTTNTYLVDGAKAGIPAGAMIQFKTSNVGQYDADNNTLYLDMGICTFNTVVLTQPKTLTTPIATVQATDGTLNEATVKLLNVDKNASGVSYEVRQFVNGKWSTWSTPTTTPSQTFQIKAEQPSAVTQVRLTAYTDDLTKFKNSQPSIYTTILKQPTHLTYSAFVYNGILDKVLSFKADDNAAGYKLETKTVTDREYKTADTLTADQVRGLNLKTLVQYTFTKEQAASFKIGSYQSMFLRLTATSGSDLYLDSIPAYSCTAFQWTQELADLFK